MGRAGWTGNGIRLRVVHSKSIAGSVGKSIVGRTGGEVSFRDALDECAHGELTCLIITGRTDRVRGRQGDNNPRSHGSLPSRLLEQRALERAEDDLSLDAQRRWLDRAYRRDLAMQISAGIGLGLVATGASLAIAGAIARSGARHRMSHADTARVRVAPALGGSGFVLRF